MMQNIKSLLIRKLEKIFYLSLEDNRKNLFTIICILYYIIKKIIIYLFIIYFYQIKMVN